MSRRDDREDLAGVKRNEGKKMESGQSSKKMAKMFSSLALVRLKRL